MLSFVVFVKLKSLISRRSRSQSITITDSGRLSQEDIDRMLKEAEEFAHEDDMQRSRIEAINTMHHYVGFWCLISNVWGMGFDFHGIVYRFGTSVLSSRIRRELVVSYLTGIRKWF